MGYSPWGLKELDATVTKHTHNTAQGYVSDKSLALVSWVCLNLQSGPNGLSHGDGRLREETGDGKASGVASAASPKWGALVCFSERKDALSLLLCHVLHPLLHVSVNLKVQDAQSDLTLCDLMDYTVHGMNPGLPHCRWILYQLSCKGSLRILGWVAYTSLANLPDPGIEPGPGGSEGKASAYNVGYLGSIPGSERSPGEGSCNPLQYSCLENPMDREAW